MVKRRLYLGFILLVVLNCISCKQTPKPANSEKTSSNPENANRVLHPSERGTILKKVQPQYPAVAKSAGVQGQVVLHAIIAKDGTIESLEAVSGPEMLKGAAIDAVKQWVYQPYLLNGMPQRVDTTITVNFQLTPSH